MKAGIPRQRIRDGSSAMSKIVIDEALQSKLNGCAQQIEFCDDSGRTVGHFVPEDLYRKMLYAYAESQCPYSEEEIRQSREEGGGRAVRPRCSAVLERHRYGCIGSGTAGVFLGVENGVRKAVGDGGHGELPLRTGRVVINCQQSIARVT